MMNMERSMNGEKEPVFYGDASFFLLYPQAFSDNLFFAPFSLL
jgi:hypothetical protein